MEGSFKAIFPRDVDLERLADISHCYRPSELYPGFVKTFTLKINDRLSLELFKPTLEHSNLEPWGLCHHRARVILNYIAK